MEQKLLHPQEQPAAKSRALVSNTESAQQKRQSQEPTAEVKQAVTLLNSKKAVDRSKGEEMLRQMGPGVVEGLLRLMASEARKRQRNRRVAVGAIAGLVALYVISIAAHWNIEGALGGLWGTVFGLLAATQLQKNSARALAQYFDDDIRTVGPLAEALEFGDKNVSTEARSVLIGLLPRLQASDDRLLNEEQRNCLNRALLKNDYASLVLAILKAWEQVGDGKALPYVEKLVAGEGKTAAVHGVQEAAEACLPSLRLRAEREQQAQMLLRPASDPNAPGEILLRPAHGVSEADPNLLLRPSAPMENR